ncbi:MAG: response regulator [Spirochaetaceae bacterium]|nr:response regulator [Spirochaetaceae bacterium]
MASQTVLVVDDDDAVRLSLRDYLIEHGHQVLVASDGVGAIQHLIDSTISVIVTDYRMDLFGGDYWIRFLKRFCSGTPVYVISGFLPPEVEIPFPVLTKPFSYGELERRISQEGGTEPA